MICDRYAHSGVAYSASKGLNFDWCVNCDRGLVAPDAIIYLDLTVEEAMKRGDFGLERYEKKDFQEKIRETFLSLKARDENTVPWHVIDANKSKEELHTEIKLLVDRIIAESAGQPLKKLWC